MKSENIAAGRQRFEFSLDVRHRGQINEVELLLPWERLAAGLRARGCASFSSQQYEKLYGRGSALAGAQLEIVVCRLRARALTPRPKLVGQKAGRKSIPKCAQNASSLHLLAGPEEIPRHAGFRRRKSRRGQPGKRAGNRGNRGYHGGGASGEDPARRSRSATSRSPFRERSNGDLHCRNRLAEEEALRRRRRHALRELRAVAVRNSTPCRSSSRTA